MLKLIRYLFIFIVISACISKKQNMDYEDNLSIMSFNIRFSNPNDNENSWENRKNEVVALIEKYQPDVLGIQEGLDNQVEFINSNIANYNNIGEGRDGKNKGEFSSIFYDSTNLKLINQKTFWLSETPNIISIGWDAALNRVCTYGEFTTKTDKDTIHVFNTHFDHLGIKARKKSAKLITSKIDEFGLDNSKVIVIGDFNSEPQSTPISTLESKLDDAQKIAITPFNGIKGTFNNFDPNMVPERRIDYIFTKNLEVKSYLHIDDKRKNNLCISDHLPVMVEVK